jgi:phage terminase large subunit GpA-like protein
MAQLAIDNSVFLDGLVDAIAPDPDYYVWEHADHKRILPKVAAAEPGLYRSSRTPFWIEVMENLSVKSPVQDTCVMKATQIGATEVGNNWFCYVVDIAPGPMLAVLPTNDLARDHSKQKLNSTIEEMPWLKAMLATGPARQRGDTMLTKMFPGGIFYLSGANTPIAFRSKSIRYLFLDDIDGFPMDVGGEGDPANLARKRTDTYANRKKIYEVSTPTIKGFSRIEMSFDESDQRYYHVPCPHCGEYQKLEFGGKDEKFGIKFTLDDWEVVDVWYVCKHCGERIDERHKTEMLSLGKWVPTKPGRKKRGYQLSSLYSPVGWVSWKQVVEEFLEAKDNPLTLKVWMNTRMGVPFEESGDQPDWVTLKNRAEPYELMSVPAKVQIITAGVDTQDDRLAVVVRGWGDFEQNWLIYYGELYGDPIENEVWTQLDNLLNYEFVREDGTKLHILAMAIDAMGHRTQAVYNYCRFRAPRVMAIQGAHSKNKPVMSMKPNPQDVTYQGEKIKNGVMLWTVGTDTAKASIYSRLRLSKGPGIYHWPIGLPDEYYLQLTSERLVTNEKNGRRVREWVKVRPRNEVLDCEVYCYAAALRSGAAVMGTIAPPVKRVRKAAEPAQAPSMARVRRPTLKYKRPDWMENR